MRRAIIFLAFVVVLVGGAYILLFKRDAAMKFARQTIQEVKGYTPAKTPDEALDRFRDAIKERDYATASTYCGGAFAEQLHKLDKAKGLAVAIDDLKESAEKHDIRLTDQVKQMLNQIDPFPTTFEKLDVKQQSNDAATAVLLVAKQWRVAVELRREGPGQEKSWKMYVAETPWLRLTVDRLVDKHKDYQKALEKIIDQIRGKEIMTMGDLGGKLENELRDAAK